MDLRSPNGVSRDDSLARCNIPAQVVAPRQNGLLCAKRTTKWPHPPRDKTHRYQEYEKSSKNEKLLFNGLAIGLETGTQDVGAMTIAEWEGNGS